jgi:hypothetical protein
LPDPALEVLGFTDEGEKASRRQKKTDQISDEIRHLFDALGP